MQAGTIELENPPDNPCFGCGPNHPRGLRLRFERIRADDGVEEVRSRFVPRPDEIGWPTLFHHGLLFTVLYECSYWTALTLGGRLWVSQGPIEYSAERLPRVGTEHLARARIVDVGPDRLRVRATVTTAAGRPCATMASAWVPARREAIERAGIVLPEYLRAEIPP